MRVPASKHAAAVVDLKARRPLDQIGVSISLKHYRRQTQCLSSWDRNDLDRLGRLVDKLRGLTLMQLTHNKQLCERHGTQQKPKRFSRPSDIDDNIPFYELKVDANNMCRLHGVFEGNVFHVVHLDHKHEAFRGKG